MRATIVYFHGYSWSDSVIQQQKEIAKEPALKQAAIIKKAGTYLGMQK